MEIYGIQDCNFVTEESGSNNYVYFTVTLEDAIKYVKETYGVDAGLDDPRVYNEDDYDEDVGESFVLIEKVQVN